jgi:hypothetical protein
MPRCVQLNTPGAGGVPVLYIYAAVRDASAKQALNGARHRAACFPGTHDENAFVSIQIAESPELPFHGGRRIGGSESRL